MGIDGNVILFPYFQHGKMIRVNNDLGQPRSSYIQRKRVWHLALGVSPLQVIKNLTFWQAKSPGIIQETQEEISLPKFINTEGEIWQASPAVLELAFWPQNGEW